MTPVSAKKWILRVFIILVLVWFLAFTALSAVMYLSWPKENKNIEAMIAQCEDIWWVRDETSQQCLEDPSTMIDSQQACEEQWGTWYAENEVCIK